ncbi:hypothetical protein CHS0354_037661, partial [Potamilus streckersoni]
MKENVISNPELQLECWQEHFKDIRNGTPVKNPPDIQHWEDLKINLEPFTMEEIITAIKKI